MSTVDIVAVQKRLGVPATGHWDHVTYGALVAYQGSKGVWPMTPTGHPDPPTLANLGEIDPVAVFDGPWHDYLLGKAKKPSTFFRDLASAGNQVPQWGWLAAGALLLGLGIWSLSRHRPGAKR